VSTLITRLFPTPSFLTLPTVGLDFSDAMMRFVELKQDISGIVPTRFAELAIPEGCIKSGRILSEAAFTSFLTEARKKHGLKYVRAAVPESQVYSFTLPLDIAAKKDIRGAIEFVLEDNIPLKTIETVFDYHVLSINEKTIVVQVVAVAEAVVASYIRCFTTAGLIPVSFELDGQAIARALLAPTDEKSYMIIDLGANRTGITIITSGAAVYTSTLEFGGRVLTEALSKELGISMDEAQALKHEHGLSAVGEHKNIFSILMNGISTLKDEINRRYVYWHERKSQFGDFPNIDTIYICGGHSNLRGLTDYLSVTLKLRVVQANPWVNCLSLDSVIPKMPYETSMSYVTAIGLALSDYLYD
jgi:type IV pilus assembly protein PilM